MKRVARSAGHERPAFLRPLGDGLWADVKGALGALAGAALWALPFGGFASLGGALVGVSAVVIVRAVDRGLKGQPDDRPRG